MTDPVVPNDPVPLCSAAYLQKRYPALCKDVDPDILADVVVEATDTIELMVDRRLAPFTNFTYISRLEGVDPLEYGADSNTPLPWQGSLGLSFANALGGADDLVRHFWVDQFAPVHPELWTYTVHSVDLLLTYGNTISVDFANGGMSGPDVTDGHSWLRIGTFAPEGTRVTVKYDGGYTVGIPPTLRRACAYQAAAFLIRDAEPQSRTQLNDEALEATLTKMLAPWARG